MIGRGFQLALVVAAFLLCAAQLPPAAFAFRPRPVPPPAAGAALTVLDEPHLTLLLRHVYEFSASRVPVAGLEEASFAAEAAIFAEDPPKPAPLAMPEGFTRAAYAWPAELPASPHAALRPPSLAARPLAVWPPPPPAPAAPADDLLDLDTYETLHERK